MRKLILAAAATLAVTASAAAATAPSVTLSNLGHRVVFFGGSATLKGRIAPAAASQKVTIEQTPQDQPARTTEVTTQSDGSFTLDVSPRIQTQVQAHYGTASSQPLVIFVRPRVSLRKFGRGHFGVVVLAARSFVGKYVWLTRWNTYAHQWSNYKKIYLMTYNQNTGGSAGDILLKLPRLTKLRAFINTSQAHPGYLNGYSNFIVS